jgi:hypothetical protein
MTRVGITCKNVLKLQPDRQHGWQRTSMHKKQHSQSEPVSRFTTFVCCTGVNAGGKKLWGVVENRFCSGALVLHAVYQACLGRQHLQFAGWTLTKLHIAVSQKHCANIVFYNACVKGIFRFSNRRPYVSTVILQTHGSNHYVLAFWDLG